MPSEKTQIQSSHVQFSRRLLHPKIEMFLFLCLFFFENAVDYNLQLLSPLTEKQKKNDHMHHGYMLPIFLTFCGNQFVDESGTYTTKP